MYQIFCNAVSGEAPQVTPQRRKNIVCHCQTVNIDNVNENRIIYQVIIDNPKVDASNVKALVIHDAKTEDIFPSVGIVDEAINLNKQTGIILMGYINKTEDINFKVLIETDQKYVYNYNY